MKSVMALVLAGSGVAVAQDAVQWRVEDGGNGHWYRFEPESLNWDQSQAIAEAQNGYLSTTTSFEEVQFALSVLEGNAAYIGGVQFPQPGDEPDGGWTWVTGEPWIFTDWPPSEPTNGGSGGEDHLEILGTSSPCWNDVPNAPRPDRGYLIEWSEDCNNDGLVDYGQILNHELIDSDGDLVPDVCQQSYASFQSSSDTVRIYGNTVFPNVDFTYEFRIRVDPSSVFGNVFGEQRDSLEEKVVGIGPDFFRGSITRGPLCGNIDEVDVNNGELDEWTHLAWVRDGEESRLYINGDLEKVWNDLDECISDSPDSVMSVGLHMHSTGTIIPGFVGDIDWLRVSSTARYSENFLPPCESELVTDGQTEVLITFNISPFVSEFTEQSSNEFRCVMGDLPGGSSPVIQQDENKFGCGDCDGDGISDGDEIANGSASDFNSNGIPDNCEADCDADGIADFIEIDQGIEFDCNVNAIPDGCELADGSAEDANGNTFLDVCEVDCNENGAFDFLDVLVGAVQDCTLNGVPDSCDIADGSEFDCDFDAVPDVCQIVSDPSLDLNGNSFLDSCEIDCNQNGSFDYLDVVGGTSDDCDANTVPDECDIESGDQLDCQNDGIPDSCQLIDGTSNDCNSNGTPDDCDPDFDGDLIPDDCDSDIDGDGSPNSTDACPMDADGCLDTDMDGICDYADPDDDGDGVDDLCDVDSTFGQDCDLNGIDDSCDPDLDGDLIPDDCDDDDDGDGVSDICDADSAPVVPPGLDPFQWAAAEGGNSHWYAGVKPSGTISWNLALQFSGVAGGKLIQLESEEEYLWFTKNLGRLPEGSFTDTGYGPHIGAKQLSADPDYSEPLGGWYWGGDWVQAPSPLVCFGQVCDSIQNSGGGTPGQDVLQLFIFPGTDVLTFNDTSQSSFEDSQVSFVIEWETTDCNLNGVLDSCELDGNDCNLNGVLDSCELSLVDDCDSNGVLDSCELEMNDCNINGVLDSCEIESNDCNSNTVLDSCELDSNDCNSNGIPDDCDGLSDCNANGIGDACDLESGNSVDMNMDGIPDECQCIPDIISDGVVDFTDLLTLLNQYGPCPPPCQSDLNGDGVVDFADALRLLSAWGSCDG